MDNSTMAFLTASEARQLEHDGYRLEFVTWDEKGIWFKVSKDGE